MIEVAPASDGGSTVTYEATLNPKGPQRLLAPLLAVAFRRIGDRAADSGCGTAGGMTASRSSHRRLAGRAVDAVAEATVVPSFSRVGIATAAPARGLGRPTVAWRAASRS